MHISRGKASSYFVHFQRVQSPETVCECGLETNDFVILHVDFPLEVAQPVPHRLVLCLYHSGPGQVQVLGLVDALPREATEVMINIVWDILR